VLCHLSSVQEFGRNAFPRGAYMSGHLEADKEPGHFWGKGYLKIVFDRIGTPNSDVTVNTKVIAAKGYKVDKGGDIKGKGHAIRDVRGVDDSATVAVESVDAAGARPAADFEG